MRIVLSPQAKRQIDEIREWTDYRYGRELSDACVREIRDAVEKLAQFPGMGRPALSRANVRELVVYPHVIQYKVDQKQVTILWIRHGAQLR